MITWPSTLPTYPLLENYTESVANNSIRTEMEQGPAKVRCRSSVGVSKISISYFLSKEQIEVLDNFYEAELKSGSIAFNFIHPRTSADVKCRFLQSPQYQAVNGNYYKVNLELEIEHGKLRSRLENNSNVKLKEIEDRCEIRK